MGRWELGSFNYWMQLSRMNPGWVQIQSIPRCTCEKASGTSYFFVDTSGVLEMLLSSSSLSTWNFSFSTHTRVVAFICFSKAANTFPRIRFKEEHQKGSTSPCKVPPHGALSRSAIQFDRSAEKKLCSSESGGWALWGEVNLHLPAEKSPAAGVRRMRTSPGFCMRKH